MKKIKLPKNWKSLIYIEEIKISKKEIKFVLLFSKKIQGLELEIGYIHIFKKGRKNFVKVVSVIPKMRGLGMGTLLYEHVIHKMGTLSTNYKAASSSAQKVWNRLLKKYRHKDDLFSGILTVFEKD